MIFYFGDANNEPTHNYLQVIQNTELASYIVARAEHMESNFAGKLYTHNESVN